MLEKTSYFNDDAHQGNEYSVDIEAQDLQKGTSVSDVASIRFYTLENGYQDLDTDKVVQIRGILRYVVGVNIFYLFWELKGRESDVTSARLRIFTKGTGQEYKYDLEPDELGFTFQSATSKTTYFVQFDVDYKEHTSETLGPIVITTLAKSAHSGFVFLLVGEDAFALSWNPLSTEIVSSYQITAHNSTLTQVSSTSFWYLNKDAIPGQTYEINFNAILTNHTTLVLDTI